MRAAVDLFKSWHANAPMVAYTGRTSNANKLARIRPLIQAFAAENAAFMRTTLGYTPARGGGGGAGQKGPAFKRLRDAVLVALTEMAGDPENATALFADTNGKVRAIAGWEEIERVQRLPHEAPLPVDDERCVMNDVDDTTIDPPYESAKEMAEAAPEVASAPEPKAKKPRKRKRDEPVGSIMAFVRAP
jgi:hypothetical protein